MSNWKDEYHEGTRLSWDQNAAYWDEYMGEGNDWAETLTWPASQRLLNLQPGERALDAACGNGLTSRRMAALGARVVAFDFSSEMIARARKRTKPEHGSIEYHVIDASDEPALLALGENSFDAALCAMALFDMADIDPLMRAVSRLLRPGGRFVFSVMHPCFNHQKTTRLAEQFEEDGKLVHQYYVKVMSYLRPFVSSGIAIVGQPALQYYFHRPLHVLFGSAFAAGLVLDGMEEPAFPPDHPKKPNPLSFANFNDIPPVLVARLRRRLHAA